ncbi:hypothetical protein [Catenulispora pinisilvae]|uniref:hypothetical protein n=1 Tax=Catenulispora pinisilvae TaxID=2705253 RepID=UPI0018912EEB|nr:hypothetical protein [Catenulispora pinisilvae]
MAHRIRSIASALLLALAALLAPLAVASVWMADEIGDTDRYVATVAPLATDPAVQNAVKAVIGHGRALTQRVGLSTGPVGPWVNRHRRAVGAAVVGVALIAFLLYDDASGTAVLTFAVLLLAALALVEFLDSGDPAAASTTSG